MIFFTSDQHFGHSNIIKYCERPFASADEMDEQLIANWNATVGPHDVVWMLGDISFHSSSLTREILRELNGSLKLVMGNHDHRFKNDKAVLDCFTEVYECFVTRTYPRDNCETAPFVLCHFPFLEWDKKYNGAIHLHGHSHGKSPVEEKFYRYDVGVDTNDFRPISLKEIFAKFS